MDTIRLQMLVDAFNQLFFTSCNTRLIGGAPEPYYLPAGDDCGFHRLFFREDYFSSALHEISHWCIAGEARRSLPDFGYWYEPEGRSNDQQRQFEQVEVRPQALEWHLSVASQQPFRVSADNISGGIGASKPFLVDISGQATEWCRGAVMPSRGRLFQDCLAQLFEVDNPRDPDHYTVTELAS